MNTAERTAKNIGVLFAAQIISRLLAFFYMMYAARYLGPANYGILTFALAFTGIFGVFTDLGLRPLTVREVARDKSLSLKYLSNVSLMKVILGAITFALISLTINLMGYPEQAIKVVYLLGLSVIFQGFTQMCYSIFQAYERMEFQALGQMLNAALMLAGIMVAIKLGLGVLEFALLYALVGFVTLIYSFTALKWKFSNPALAWSLRMVELDWSFWKPVIKQAWPFGLTTIFIMIYYYIDSVMLSMMKGSEFVGWYNAAYRIALVLLAIPTVFNSAVFPIMAQFSISSRSSLKFTYQKYFKYMVLLSIPIGVGTTLLSDRLILLIFGQEYAPSIIPLQILIWSTVFIYLNGVFGRLVESLNRQILGTKVAGVGAILNIVLNLLLIPRYGYIGASATTVATELAILLLMGIISFRLGYSISLRVIARNVGKAIVASAVMGIFIWRFEDFNLGILVVLSALIYFIFIWISKFFDKDDMNLAKQLISRFRRSVE